MPREKPLVIGPFKGGLNTQSDPTDVKDDQVTEALNLDQDLNGSFRSRPPFVTTGATLTLGVSGDPVLLGFFYIAGANYLIASDGLSSTYYFNGSAWALITNTFAASAMAQFDGKAWLVSPIGEVDPGGYWTVAGGFVADSNMPHGSSIAVYKDRMFVAEGVAGANPTAMYYSKLIPEGTIWASYASRIVQVSPGDGQAIVALVSYYNSLLIFRTQSIFSYAYASSTAAATISVLVPGIGLTAQEALTVYESYIYFMYDDRAYEFTDNRVRQINTQVPLRAGSKSGIGRPFAASIFNNRVIFSYYDYLYVYNLDTRTWTRWQSTVWGSIGQIMSPVPGTGTPDAYGLPSLTANRPRTLVKINEAISASAEAMTCVVQTKNYNYGNASNFKRMFWWGLDAIFRNTVTGEAHPVVQRQIATWGDLWTRNLTWADLLNTTWQSPGGSDPIAEVTTYNFGGLGYERKFVKFKKQMRFRQVYFRVALSTDGSIASAPVQIFGLTVYLTVRQTVSATVS